MGRPSKSDDFANTAARSFRFNARHRFALRLLSRQTGKTETAILEDAIHDLANSLSINKKQWLQFYDHDEGVAVLRLLAEDEYRASLVELDTLSFVQIYPQYFYTDKNQKVPNRPYVRILWPNMKKLMELWRESRNEDPSAVVKEMNRLLKEGGEKIPPRV